MLDRTMEIIPSGKSSSPGKKELRDKFLPKNSTILETSLTKDYSIDIKQRIYKNIESLKKFKG